MSTHKDCGEEIRWAHRPDDPERFFPPLEYAGEVYIIDEGGNAIQMHGYRMHRCDPEKVEAWQEYIAKISDLKGPDSYEADINYRHAASERNREQLWETALTVICPSCEEPVGKRCHSMSKHLIQTGELTETRWPHPSRTEAAINAKNS